jgi:very-short-patch-repair endonuclease
LDYISLEFKKRQSSLNNFKVWFVYLACRIVIIIDGIKAFIEYTLFIVYMIHESDALNQKSYSILVIKTIMLKCWNFTINLQKY